MKRKKFILVGLVYLLSIALNHLPTNKLLSIPAAQTQEKCKTALVAAEKAFKSGSWDEIIKLLPPCLPDSIQTKEAKLRAYELLSIAYILKNKEFEAKTTIKELIKLENEFKPHIDAPRKFKELVEEEKQHQKKMKRIKNVLIIGGSVFVASVVTGIITGGEKKEKELPTPPSYPDH